MIENLNCQGCRIWQPIDRKHWQTEVLYLLCVLKYFKSNETCLLWNFSKKCKAERSKCLVQGHNMRACTGFELMTLGSWVRSFNTWGVSTLVLVGMCHWEFESGPIFIANFPKILTHFNTKNLDFSKIWHDFSKFSEIFENFNPKFMKFANLVTNWRKFWKVTHLYTNFAAEKGVIVIPGGRFCNQFQRHVPIPTFVLRTPQAWP